jgi:hypothetical protein
MGREMGRSRFLSSIFFFHQRKSYFGKKKQLQKKDVFFHEKVVLYQKKTHTLKFPKKQLKFHQETGFLIFTSGTQGLLHSRDFATLVSYPRNEVGQWEEAAQEFGR